MTSPLQVVIADDHPFYRSGIARALRASGVVVAAEAPNGAAAIEAVRETSPDVVVMDLNMPGMSGLEATRRLLDEDPGRRVLMLTVSAGETDLAEAILAGACGYVLKDRPVQEVIDGIRAAAEGGLHVSARLAMPLLRRLREPTLAPGDLVATPLEPGEQAVLRLVEEGRAVHDISESLGISAAEVDAHAAAILAKLRPERRQQAALRATGREPD